MDKWAAAYADAAHFLCVGCAGPALASEFRRRLKLSQCMVTFTRETDGPLWGQLGCNGFIVLDAAHRVVCPATAAFLELRELAFAHVETLVDALVAGASPPRVCPGQALRVRGLQAQRHLNGAQGVCTAREGPDGRCEVRLRSRERLRIKLEHLVILDANGDEQPSDATAAMQTQMQTQQRQGTTQTTGDQPQVCEPSADPRERKRGRVSTPASCDLILPLGPIDSVLVAALDREHDACAAQLRTLAESRSTAALRAVLASYEAHFSHEEQLLDQHVYSVDAGGHEALSAPGFDALAGQRRSHFADHNRLLNDIKAQLSQLASTGASGVVPVAFVDKVLRDFETHAHAYDGTYAEPLARALAAAAS